MHYSLNRFPRSKTQQFFVATGNGLAAILAEKYGYYEALLEELVWWLWGWMVGREEKCAQALPPLAKHQVLHLPRKIEAHAPCRPGRTSDPLESLGEPEMPRLTRKIQAHKPGATGSES